MKISMIYKTGLPAAILMLVSLILPMSSMADEHPQGDYATGATVWAQNCGRCHNIRDARELRDDQWYTTVFHMRMRAGLTGQETRDVVAFLTASNKPKRKVIIGNVPVASSSGAGKADGQAIYNQTCVACHGGNGKGTLPGAPDFTKAGGVMSKSDDELIKNITNGFQSPGSPMAMPAKGGNSSMTAADVKAVLAYIHKFTK